MERLARLAGRYLALICVSTVVATDAVADDLKLKALLIWGTNEKPPEGKNLKLLPEELRSGLRAFRWKNYYIVKTETITATKKTSKVVLSERCTLTIQNVATGQVDAQLFNPMSSTPEKPVFAQRLDFKEGHRHAIAGDSKDNWDDAWAVYLVPVE